MVGLFPIKQNLCHFSMRFDAWHFLELAPTVQLIPYIYILHLFHLEDTSFLFLFISESVKVRFLPRVDFLMLFIVYKQCARSRRVHIEDHMNRFEYLSSRTIITITYFNLMRCLLRNVTLNVLKY